MISLDLQNYSGFMPAEFSMPNFANAGFGNCIFNFNPVFPAFNIPMQMPIFNFNQFNLGNFWNCNFTTSGGGGSSSGKLSKNNPTKYDGWIEKYAKEFGVDPALVKALIKAESGFNPSIVSPRGAIGLMQLLKSTAKEYGCNNPKDPEQNIKAGVKFLKHLLDKYNGNKDLAIAAYNAGPGRVKDKVPAIKETQNHVRKVNQFYKEFKA